MKVLLIRSPRYYWPFINEYDNFLLPQSLPCLATVLRNAGIEVKIIDCMPLRIGWKSLYKLVEEEKPQIVGVGDSESLYSTEAVKVLKMAKEINPNIITVVGGAHFSNLIEETLNSYPVDFIVRGEGEYTFLELIKEIEKKNPDYSRVRGIAYKEDNQIIITPPRPLIDNLDELPLPAYDLMPMSEYGKARYLFDPGGITIHHSRGCPYNCKFCVWWVQMAEEEIKDGKIIKKPRWRTKSVPYTLEEISLLYYKYNKHFLVFVDDSWNLNPAWSEEFAEELIKKNLNLRWFAFMRADGIIKDEKRGILEKLVKSGLSHISIGVERKDSEELKDLGKPSYSEEVVRECFKILKQKYPQVFRQATFIVGIREETKESMLRVAEFAKEIDVDYPGFHPLTPIPGTELWKEAKEKGWLEIRDYSYFDWFTPVMSSKYLKREEIEELMIIINRKFTRFSWLIKGLFSRYPYKRYMYIWWLLVVARIFLKRLKNFLNPFKISEYPRLIKPSFYDD